MSAWQKNCKALGQDMASVQIVLTDADKAAALRAMVLRSTQFTVECPDQPDPQQACVVVVDPVTLARIPPPIRHPERIVLIAKSDPASLQDAWNAGVNSVVSNQDPLNTVVLAILSASLCRPVEPGASAEGKRRLRV